MTKELFLDTGGSCFFCLQEPVNHIENVISEVNLHSICRYLNIHPSSILRKALIENLLEGEKYGELFPHERFDFSATLCSTCSSITSKLTDLFSQLERINNFLRYQLQVFVSTIGSSGKDPGSSELLKNCRVVTQEGAVEVNLVETLRKGIREKCALRMKEIAHSSLPKVLLERLILDPGDGIAPPTKNESSIEHLLAFEDMPCLSPQTPLPPEKGELHPYISPSTEAPPPNLKSETDFHKQMVKDICKQNSSRTDNKYLCSICGYSSPNGFPPIRIHLVNAHPQIFFISQKPNHMTDATFTDYCRRLYSKEILKAKQRGSIINWKQSFPCEICNRKYFCRSNFKYHLLLEHFKILEAKLNHLLTAPPTNQRLILHKKRAGPTADKSNTSCTCGFGVEECGSSSKCDFCSRRNLQRLLVCSGDTGCGSRFTSLFSLRRHLRTNICQTKKGRSKNHNSSVLFNSLAVRTDQSDGLITFIGPEPIVPKKKKERKKPEKPEKKLWICKEEDGGCGKILTQRWSLMNHKKNHCSRLGRKIRWACELLDGGCGNTFSNRYALQRHQQNYCSRRTISDQKEMDHSQIGKLEPEENFDVEMECEVETVMVRKIEVIDNQEESEVAHFENFQEFENDPLQLCNDC